jgi:hypothetical protein
MNKIPWQELLIVAGVGVGLTLVGKRVPVLRNPLILGAGLYTLGYVIGENRPASGWKQLQDIEAAKPA